MSFEGIPVAKSGTEESPTQKAVNSLIEKIKQSPLNLEYDEVTMESRRERLVKIAEHILVFAPHILRKFRALTTEQGIDAGKIGFYIVGGRVLASPIKDNTDIDFVITSENSLVPYAKDARITYPQRHAIARKLYAEIEQLFNEKNISDLYEKGILEIKGLGESTMEEIESQEGVLKIAELE